MASQRQRKVIEGYCKLSKLFVEYPEYICLRKFAQLNTELLLYKQAEICHFEQRIEALRRQEAQDLARSWQSWNTANCTDPLVREKQNLFEELDKKLRLYQEDVLRAVQFEAISQPSKLSRKSVRLWLNKPSCGDGFLKGCEARPWKFEHGNDLVCISEQPDYLDSALMAVLAPVWHFLAEPFKKSMDVEKGIGSDVWTYSLQYFIRLGNILCVFASAAIPSLSIFGLFYVEDFLCRLVMITCFTLTFAAVVLLGFGCRRNDTFAATVAFAAVQVVFVEGVNSIKS